MKKDSVRVKSNIKYEGIYKKSLEEVGHGRYSIAEPGDPLISVFGLDSLEMPFLGVCAGTGSVLQVDFIYRVFLIPKGSEILIQRVLRPCNHGGVYHGNADDYLYFPVKSGNIVRISRIDSPDHFVSLSATAGLENIASAYHLPELRSGPISQYVENGALMPIRIDCPNDKVGQIIDIKKLY